MSQIKCPTCGAATSDAHDACEYCGADSSAASNLTPDQHTKAFAKYIEQTVARARAGAKDPEYFNIIDKERATATAIKSFPAPTKPDSLAAFFVYCHGNVTVEGYEFGGELEAWRSKAKGAYEALRLASLSNPQLASFLEDFKSSYSAGAIKALEASAKKEKNVKLLLGLVLCLPVLAIWYFIITGLRSCGQ